MKTKKQVRKLLIVVVITALLIGCAYFVCGRLYAEGLEAYRVLSPASKTVALEDMKTGSLYIVDNALLLINEDYPLTESFVSSASEYKNSGVFMSEELHDSYEALSLAVKNSVGDTLYVSSAARDSDKQESLYREDPTVAAKPGCSEHEAGLALDVYVDGFSGAAFLKSEAGRFVNNHCHRYGFIIRYPAFGEHITGIPFEPWHIRYVGAPHAQVIKKHGWTLEEYIALLEPDCVYKIDGYYVSRQPLKNGKLQIPYNCRDVRISPDNTGHYIITGRCGAVAKENDT